MREADVLSLDVFDTALMRRVRKPGDVFLFAQVEARKFLSNANFPFAQCRASAERLARRTARRDNGTDEVTLAQIYRSLATVSGLDEQTCEDLARTELGAERSLCYANRLILTLANQAAQSGKRTIYISDTYYSAAQVRELLQANGFEAPDVFVSSEALLSKHEGRLFDFVRQATGLDPRRILHVGDNHHSDCTQARNSGWNGVLYKLEKDRVPFVDQISDVEAFTRDALPASLTVGLVRKRQFAAVEGTSEAELLHKIGYEVAGPIYFAFSSWVMERARALGLKRLFFLSRDGHNLLEAFRRMSSRWGIEIKGTYLYASRRLCNVASIEQLDNAALDFLLTANPALRLRDFFARIGLDPEEYRAALRNYGFPSLDHVLTTDIGGAFRSEEEHARLRLFFKLISGDIESRSLAERTKLLAYLKSQNFGSPGQAIVDLGWRASLLTSLQTLTRFADPEFCLRGFYFGTWDYAHAALETGGIVESLFFHLGQPAARKELISECVELVEFLFTAPHATVIGLAEDAAADGWKPVYGQSELGARHQTWGTWIRDGALAYVDEMLILQPHPIHGDDLLGYVEVALRRVLERPAKEEAKILGGLPHRDSFGDASTPRLLAKPPSFLKRLFSSKSIASEYKRSYWKKAYRAQLMHPQRRLDRE